MRTCATCSAAPVQCSAHHLCIWTHTIATPPHPHMTIENATHMCHDRCLYCFLASQATPARSSGASKLRYVGCPATFGQAGPQSKLTHCSARGLADKKKIQSHLLNEESQDRTHLIFHAPRAPQQTTKRHASADRQKVLRQLLSDVSQHSAQVTFHTPEVENRTTSVMQPTSQWS